MRRWENRDLRVRGAHVFLLVVVLICTAAPARQPAVQASALTLWHDRATSAFEEALPLGNGRLGAMVFGDAASERVMLEALFKGDYKLADQLTKKLQGKYSQSYAPLGDLHIDASLPTGAGAEAFRRQLDLQTATARTSFSFGSASFTRDYFVSYPDRVLVIRLTASAPGALAFTVRADSQLRRSVTVDGPGDLVLAGRAPKHAEPNCRRDIKDPLIYDDAPDGKGTRFAARVRILKTDGRVERGAARSICCRRFRQRGGRGASAAFAPAAASRWTKPGRTVGSSKPSSARTVLEGCA
jgi:alpha-L-fucosidase 2